jgi:hypothetical protein
MATMVGETAGKLLCFFREFLVGLFFRREAAGLLRLT